MNINQQQSQQLILNQSPQPQQQATHIGMPQTKLIPNQFVQQAQPASNQPENPQFVPQQAHQFQVQNPQFAQQNQGPPSPQVFNQQQIIQNQFTQNRAVNQFNAQNLITPQQQQQQQLINQHQIQTNQQLINQQVINKPLLLNQGVQQSQPPQAQGQPAGPQPKPLWQQQQPQPQPQQLTMRHPATLLQQPQPQQAQGQPAGAQAGPRVQWSPNQQPTGVPQRQFIHLDAQTHQQLQQMAPEQRALFIAKLQKQRQVFLQQRQQQLQMQQQQQQQVQQQQQRTGHVLIRSGPVPQGLNPQQQMQWLQQQAKQQGVMLQQSTTNIVQNASLTQTIQHAPGLSPIQQQGPQFNDQNQLQLQRQQQFRLQQLQLQREQAQKNLPTPTPTPPQQPPLPQASVVRPMGPAPTPEINTTTTVIDTSVSQQQLVVNAKTKTALANMLSIRLQSGGASMGPTSDTITEPSAAGTLRFEAL